MKPRDNPTTSPSAGAAAAVSAGLTAGVCAVEGAGAGLSGVVAGGALGVVVGAGMLCALATAMAMTASLKWRAMWMVVPASLGVLAAVWLESELGALPRLGGRYQTLAIATLIGEAGCAAGLFLCLAIVWPHEGAPFGVAFRLRPRRRGLLASALGAGACGATLVSTLWLPDGYPAAGLALALGSWTAGGCAVWLFVGDRLRVGPAGLAALGGVVALSSFTSIALIDDDQPEVVATMADGASAGAALFLARLVTDVDADGASGLLGGGDCRAFDSAVHPAAQEIPGNGIDDNCLRGDASRAMDAAVDVPVPEGPPPTSVVLITVDTLAADHMSLYGRAKNNTTPTLDAWAKDAMVFERAYTPGAWTSLALPSMLFGVYPRKLKWTKLYADSAFRSLRRSELDALRKKGKVELKGGFSLPLDEPRQPLPWWLGRRGMKTVAIVDDGHSDIINKAFFGRAFDRFVEMSPGANKVFVTDGGTSNAALRELRRLQKGGAPFFMWIHYFGPHMGNRRHKSVPRFGGSQVDKYEHEIAYADQQIGRVLDAIDETSLPITTIVTADHGESVGKRGRGHGNRLNDHVMWIPLIIKGPGVPSGRSDRVASLVDVLPTVLALTETPAPPHLDGVHLLGPAQQEQPRVVLSETWRFNKQGKVALDVIAGLDGEWSYALNRRTQARYRLKTAHSEGDLPAFESQQMRRLVDAVGIYLEEWGSVRAED